MKITGSQHEGLNLAVVSDIHLGHKLNPTAFIINNLMKAFPDNAETAKLHVIFLAGDIYDHLLSLPQEESAEIDLWIAYILRLCKKHDILLRVLEGTPSHDREQSRRFEVMNDAGRIGADLKYVKELSIEYIERYGISVLYVPDEWDDSTDKTLSQVHDLLRAKGLTQVDIAVMHGQFEFQLPPHVSAPKHSSTAYLKLVRHLIFIGHVHVYSYFERIYAQGSFDRISHGEEGPKGHIRATIHSNGERDVVFVVNEDAKKFVTVDCGTMDMEQTLSYIQMRVDELPDHSNVRVRADWGNPIFTHMEELIRRWPMLNFKPDPKKPDEKKSHEEEAVTEEPEFVPISITKANIQRLLLSRVSASGATLEVLQQAEAILEEVI